MATDIQYVSYGDTSIKEDVVLNAIELVSSQEATLFNMLGRTNAISTVHSYLNDTLATAATSAVAEGADYSTSLISTPTRNINIVETIAYSFRVSHVQKWVEHYQGGNELERITAKAMKQWAKNTEFDIMRSTLVSGASNATAPKMNGVLAIVTASGNYTAQTSGTAFVASILDGLMKLTYDNGNGEVASDLFVGSYLRFVIDGFTQKSNVVVNGSMTTLIRTITTFETSFGTLNIHTHRFINIAGTDATGRVLGLRPEKWKLAFLQKPYIDTDLSRAGSYDARAIVGALTVEARNPLCDFYATGYNIG